MSAQIRLASPGVQIKAPMYLDRKGVLSPATGQPFTHILKPAGTSGYDALPVVEWIAMELGRAAGFEAPATALVAMPDKMPPALLVERFDIRESDIRESNWIPACWRLKICAPFSTCRRARSTTALWSALRAQSARCRPRRKKTS